MGIAYIDFLENVRHDISPKRRATVDHVWDEISSNGVVELSKMLGMFCPDNHPHVRCRVKEAEPVFKEFEEAITKRSADSKHLT